MTTRQTILLIEDSQILRDLVLQVLEIENYEPLIASDGLQGLKLARERKPDLVLCDISMPRMDGHEVLRALRADPATAAVPFIFLTAKADRSDLRAGMELGADDYLTKPFDANELLAAIHTRLTKHESTRAATLQDTDKRQADLVLKLPHEIRTPLTGILGLAELLIATDFTAEERKAMVGDILASGRRLERTLTNLILHLELELALHSPDRARQFSMLMPANVAESARRAAAQAGAQYGKSAVIEVAPETLLVAMEDSFFRKILEEILDNALRFTGPRGVVRLTAAQAGKEVTIEIVDDGVGMTAEQLARAGVLHAYDRLQGEKAGFGLGLAITRRLIEFNSGHLLLASRPGGGVSVTIRLAAAG